MTLSGEREPSVLQMIKVHAEPVVHLVALLAGSREACGQMTRPRSSLIVLGVAGIALRRHRAEVAERSILVAGITIHRGVRAYQRKPVLVLLDLLDRNLPTSYGVALFTTGPKLPLVNIGVTVGTLCAHITEHRLGVALGASHTQVHTAQRIARLVVIKFRDAADGLPSADGVAVLAGNIQVAVRAASVDVGLRLLARRGRAEK